jgi:hypothetical protein
LILGWALYAATLSLVVRVVHARDPIQDPNELLLRYAQRGLGGILDNDGRTFHNVGNVLLNVTNFGLIGALPGARLPFEDAPSGQWPAGSGTEYLWGAGLWVGALDDGVPIVSAWEIQDGKLLLEFFPGRDEVDRVYTTTELAAHGARAPSSLADDDGDGAHDEDRLDGRDNDGDGRIDEDFRAISNQMLTCSYRDDDPQLLLQAPDHRPLGIQVIQSSFAWDTDFANDFVGFEFEIINRSPRPLFDVYVGFFADFDIGPRQFSANGSDDIAAFWEGIEPVHNGDRFRNAKLSIGYMYDADGDNGQSPGYGGILFLGSQRGGRRSIVELHNFQKYTATSPSTPGGRPANDGQRYEILRGGWPGGAGPANPATGLREPQVAAFPADYRMVVSTGPFAFIPPRDTIRVQLALVFGDGFADMVENAKRAQQVFDGVWMDCDGDESTGQDRRETPRCGPEHAGDKIRVDPCDAACDGAPPVPPCTVRVPPDSCIWVNADCDLEIRTGIPTGVDGRECHIPWVSPMAPLPPSMRLVGWPNQIEVLWDNRSELVPDPLLGARDFESYRIWRADGWTRPPGTNVDTGPGASLWFRMAEFDILNGVGPDVGLKTIRYSPVPSHVVEFYREWREAHPELPPPDLPGLTPGQIDSARAMARGVRYYRFVDPPFVPNGHVGAPCPESGGCPPIPTPDGPVPARCDPVGRCAETTTPPMSGMHVFYSVTATDHTLEQSAGSIRATAPGLAGSPSSNFAFINPTTRALPPEEYGLASEEIYVVPNPVTRESLAPWKLHPNNDDPSGAKVEFRHVPQSRGRISIWTLAADLVRVLEFDARDGNGTVTWDLLSRNGQEVTSGVYLFTVEAEGFERFIGRFVVIR